MMTNRMTAPITNPMIPAKTDINSTPMPLKTGDSEGLRAATEGGLSSFIIKALRTQDTFYGRQSASPHLVLIGKVNMKAELQEVMGMLRKLQGSIDFGNAPADEREELATDVADIMDELFAIMKRLPDEE